MGAGLVTKIKDCAPHICCYNCSHHLRNWINGKGHPMHFVVPVIATTVWCIVIRKKFRRKGQWHNPILCLLFTQCHMEDFLYLKYQRNLFLCLMVVTKVFVRDMSPDPHSSNDPNFVAELPCNDPHKIAQNEWSHLIITINVRQIWAWDSNNEISKRYVRKCYRMRLKDFTSFITEEDTLAAFINILCIVIYLFPEVELSNFFFVFVDLQK